MAGWRQALGWAAGALAGVLALAVLVPAGAQTPVVQPGDVSTPAPTPTRMMQAWPAMSLPTPTPAPTPAITATASLHDLPAQHYIVRAGDTVLSVALETGLDLEEVPCAVAPDFRTDQPLVIGDRLAVPPANIACHTVAAGEALADIATLHGVTPEQIYLLPWNQLADAPMPTLPLTPGLHLRVPLPLPATWDVTLVAGTDDGTDSASGDDFLARMLRMPVNTSPFTLFVASDARTPRTTQMGPVPADWPYGSGNFTWPVYGWLSQSYRYDHRAIDVAAQLGTPITAADRGVVVRAGWNDQGYGRFVIIDHNIDYLTLYAHLDRVLVGEGEVVGQGQVIGTVGSTGNSTGPHLHFEIRDFGRLINPLELLGRE